MSWFLRKKQLVDNLAEPREMPDGLFTQCPDCKSTIYKKQFEENLYTCPSCNYHFRITSREYEEILFDAGTFVETETSIRSTDMLDFVDTKPYTERLKTVHSQSEFNDALTTGTGEIGGMRISYCCMNFRFIGGSMGSVVGEKFYRAAMLAIREEIPLVVITASGGARMQESAFSLMQMAKTSAVLGELAEKGLPYISVLTDPTTGGVSASFAMLGDVNIAEPNALIGFAGPRVVEQTIRKKLPEGFQRSESVLQHGFIDKIVHRKELKEYLLLFFDFFMSERTKQ